MIRTLHLELGEHRFPIYIGDGLLQNKEPLDAAIGGEQVFLLSDAQVAPLYLESVRQLLGDKQLTTLVLPAGETAKSLATMERIYTQLLEQEYHRDATLLALGGGVIGDLTGFAAATYQRGVDFVQLPTTLLAQVDAAVGGKTAINHPLGKNMIGAFHQPRAVIADVDTLQTLPAREFSAGLAEVIKYGLIGDADFFQWLETEIDALAQREPGRIIDAVYRSCVNKAGIVARDEREAGERALLNLGHTFGHAIEAAQQYRGLLHGEAVAVGIMLAARLSQEQGRLEPGEVQRIDTLLERAGLPRELPPALDAELLLRLMRGDKKVRGGRQRLVLLDAIGSAVLADSPGEAVLRRLLQTGG